VGEFFARLEAMDIDGFVGLWAEDGVQEMPFARKRLDIFSPIPISAAHNVGHKSVLCSYRHALSFGLTTGGV
jgi:hypothetical protein